MKKKQIIFVFIKTDGEGRKWISKETHDLPLPVGVKDYFIPKDAVLEKIIVLGGKVIQSATASGKKDLESPSDDQINVALSHFQQSRQVIELTPPVADNLHLDLNVATETRVGEDITNSPIPWSSHFEFRIHMDSEKFK